MVEVTMATMTESQRSLLESYESGKYAYVSKKALREDIEEAIENMYEKIRIEEQEIEEYESNLREIKSLKDIKRRGWRYTSYEDFVNSIKKLIEWRKRNITAYKKYIEMQRIESDAVLKFVSKRGELVIRRITTVYDAEDEGYLVVSSEELEKPLLGKLVWVQKPHLCGGFGKYIGPYHIGCTKCDEELKLWEHGIDYDLG